MSAAPSRCGLVRAGSCSRRTWVTAAIASLAGFGSRAHAQTRVETRAVSGIRAVLWQAAGELVIEQTQREHLSIEAEPAVLAKIVAEVHQGRLTIGFAPGQIETRYPIRFRLELKALEALELSGAGTTRIGPLSTPALSLRLAGSETLKLARLEARALDVHLDGSGELTIDGGRIERQRVVIAGAADYSAPRLASQDATVAIDGSGTIRLAVAERLHATIAGSGDVLYVGEPQVVQAVSGSGEVRRLGHAKP